MYGVFLEEDCCYVAEIDKSNSKSGCIATLSDIRSAHLLVIVIDLYIKAILATYPPYCNFKNVKKDVILALKQYLNEKGSLYV